MPTAGRRHGATRHRTGTYVSSYAPGVVRRTRLAVTDPIASPLALLPPAPALPVTVLTTKTPHRSRPRKAATSIASPDASDGMWLTWAASATTARAAIAPHMAAIAAFTGAIHVTATAVAVAARRHTVHRRRSCRHHAICHVATTLAWATGAPIGRRSCCYLRSLRQHRWRLRNRRLVARAVVVASVLSAMARRRRGAPRHRPTWHSGYGQHKLRAALHGSERPQFKGMSSHLRARHVVIAVEHMVASLQYEHWATWRGDVPTVRAARDDGRRAAQGSRTRWCAGPCKAAAATRRRLGRAVGHLTRTARRAYVPWDCPKPACWDNRLFSLKRHPGCV